MRHDAALDIPEQRDPVRAESLEQEPAPARSPEHGPARQATAGQQERPTALVLRALHLGDLLVAVPALRALRRALPGHRIALAAPAGLAPLIPLIGAVDELVPTPDLARPPWAGPPPDVAVNLHGRGPQSHHVLDALHPRMRIGFRAPGWDGPDFDEIAARHPHERERWCAMLDAHGIPADPTDLRLAAPPPHALPLPGAPVVVHPGARYSAKRWPAGRFAAVAAALHCPGLAPVLITGTAEERDLGLDVATSACLPESRVLAGRTDLLQLCSLVSHAALVVSGDTGIAHVAFAFGTPSVTLFGPVDPARWGPPAGGPHAVLGEAAVRRGDPFADDPDPALLAVGVGDVLRAAATVRAHAPRAAPTVNTGSAGAPPGASAHHGAHTRC